MALKGGSGLKERGRERERERENGLRGLFIQYQPIDTI